MTDKPTPVRLEVRDKCMGFYGNRFHGTLVWSDGERWYSWQVHKTLKALVKAARCSFDGPIVRVTKDGKFLPAS